MANFKRTITAADGSRRAVILERPDGRYQVDCERWDDTAVSGVGGLSDPFWRFEGGERVADTLVEAERLAGEWTSNDTPTPEPA